VNAFPVMTKDFDVFNPYDQPLSGKVTQVDLYDCDTMEKIQVTPTEEKLVRMKLVGGNDCVFFDEETQAFIQKDLNQGNYTSAKIWDEENKVFSDQNVVYCSSNNLGMYMAVETNQEKNAAMGLYLNFMMVFLVFIWLKIFG